MTKDTNPISKKITIPYMCSSEANNVFHNLMDQIRRLELSELTNKEEAPSKALEIVKSIEKVVEERFEAQKKSYFKPIEEALKLEYKNKTRELEINYEKELDKFTKEKKVFDTKFNELVNDHDIECTELEDSKNDLRKTIKTLTDELKQSKKEYLTSLFRDLGTNYKGYKVKFKVDGFFKGKEVSIPTIEILDTFEEIVKTKGLI